MGAAPFTRDLRFPVPHPYRGRICREHPLGPGPTHPSVGAAGVGALLRQGPAVMPPIGTALWGTLPGLCVPVNPVPSGAAAASPSFAPRKYLASFMAPAISDRGRWLIRAESQPGFRGCAQPGRGRTEPLCLPALSTARTSGPFLLNRVGMEIISAEALSCRRTSCVPERGKSTPPGPRSVTRRFITPGPAPCSPLPAEWVQTLPGRGAAVTRHLLKL